jgi:glycosyltransferase involved in cell wall biosynthesis
MITIITVVWNGVSTIEETILSVINQDYDDFEYIIIDGVSTDGTLEILEKYAEKIDIIKSEPDKGIYDAMNKGIALANGDWIYFLGCDDVLYSKSTLSNIFASSSYAEFNVIYGSVLLKQSNKIYDGQFDYAKLCNRSICHQAIFYREEQFSKYGSFDTRYITAADYVFNAKSFCAQSNKWKYVDEVVAIYNEEGVSKSRDSNSLNDNFAFRYDNFRSHVSRLVLARIFWSSFFKYFRSHDLKDSMRYFSLIRKDIGFFRLITYLPIIVTSRIKVLFAHTQ